MEHHCEVDRYGVADAWQARDFAQGFDAADQIETVGHDDYRLQGRRLNAVVGEPGNHHLGLVGIRLAAHGQVEADGRLRAPAYFEFSELVDVELRRQIRFRKQARLEQHVLHALVANRDQRIDADEFNGYLGVALIVDFAREQVEGMDFADMIGLDGDETQGRRVIVELPLRLGGKCGRQQH